MRISVAAGEVAVLLRHRLRLQGRADRQRPGRRRASARSIGADSLGYVSLDGPDRRQRAAARRGCARPASTATTRSRCPTIWSASTCSRASSAPSPPARPAPPGTPSRSSGSSTRPPADRRGDHPGEIERTLNVGMAGPAVHRPRHAGLGGRRGRPRHRAGPPLGTHPLAVTRPAPVAGLPQRVSGAEEDDQSSSGSYSSSSTSSSIAGGLVAGSPPSSRCKAVRSVSCVLYFNARATFAA